MKELYDRLGIPVNADAETIKRAFKNRAREFHPDKIGGSTEKMQKLNEAYSLLMDPEALKKYVAENTNDEEIDPEFFLNSTGERPSEAYRRLLQAMLSVYAKLPEDTIKPVNTAKAFADLNKPFLDGLLPYEYYRDLYKVKEDGVVYENVYEFIAHKGKWAETAPQLSTNFFKETLTFEKGLVILSDFLQGKYYGLNLKIIQNYVLHQIARLKGITYDIVFFDAMLTIITSTDLAKNHKKILQAVDKIYSYIYQTHAIEKKEVIKFIQNKYFRYFIASALKHDWQDPSFTGPKEILQQLQSQFGYLVRISPMAKVHLALEKKLKHMLTREVSIESIYECAYLFVDMMASAKGPIAFATSALTAAQCFQHAATRESSQPAVMAAEYIALSLYQSALQQGFKTGSLLGLYIANQSIKCLAALKYDQSTIRIEDILLQVIQPGDAAALNLSGSVTSSIRTAIRKAIDTIDIAPFYSRPLSTLDLEITHVFHTVMLGTSLHEISNRANITDFSYPKVAYSMYELALQGFFIEKDENKQEEELLNLKMKAMEALLEKGGSNLFKLSTLVGPSFSTMKCNAEGFFEPTNELNFPEAAGIKTYSEFKGFKVDRKNNTIELMTAVNEVKDPTTGQMKESKLFTSYDVAQMWELGLSDAQISLDAAGEEPYNPLQLYNVYPKRAKGTALAEALLAVDRLLKYITHGVEVSGIPPYLQQNTDALFERLPADIKHIFNLLRDPRKRANAAHRFWFTSVPEGSIETLTTKSDQDVETVLMGKTTIQVKKHLLNLSFNDEGELNFTDAPIDPNDNSPEGQFARLFTENYDRIGEYFPELLRVKELLKISSAIKKLKEMRLINNAEIQYYQTQLADTVFWESQRKKSIVEKTNALIEGFKASKLPAIVTQMRPLTDSAWWQTKYNSLLAEHSSKLRSACLSHPKYVFNINDAEVTNHYNERYNFIYNDYYNSLYESNKTSLIAEHGIAVWNHNEANIRQQVTEAVQNQMPSIITKQKVLDGFNQAGAQGRASQKNAYYQQLAHIRTRVGEAAFSPMLENFMSGNYHSLAAAMANDELNDYKQLYTTVFTRHYELFPQVKKRIGENAYKTCIEQLLQQNVVPLATAIANDEIDTALEHFRALVVEKQAFETMFVRLEFDSDKVVVATKKDDNYYIPAVDYYHNTGGSYGYRVYGGFSHVPTEKEVTNLSQNLNSSIMIFKSSAIEAAENFLDSVRSTARSCALIGSGYAASLSNIYDLQSSVQKAKTAMWDLTQTERLSSFSKSFDNYHTSLHSQTFDYLNPSNNGNFSDRDPYAAWRYEDHQQDVQNAAIKLAEELRKKEEERKREAEVQRMAAEERARQEEENRRREEANRRRMQEAVARAQVEAKLKDKQPNPGSASASAAAVADNSTTNESSGLVTTRSLDVYPVNNRGVIPKPFHRADGRQPLTGEKIFETGFESRSKTTEVSLLDHVLPGIKDGQVHNFHTNSPFISTSTKSTTWKSFPLVNNAPGVKTVVHSYEIQPIAEAKNVVQELKPLVKEGVIPQDVFDRVVKSEKEMAIPFKIKPEDIRGARPITVIGTKNGEKRIPGKFIPNDKFIVPMAEKVERLGKGLGNVFTLAAVACDTNRLLEAYKESDERLISESKKVAGGWVASGVASAAAAKVGAVYCAPAGPTAAALCAIGAGFVGGAVGYQYGEEAMSGDEKDKPNGDNQAVVPTGDLRSMSFFGRGGVNPSKPNVNEDNNTSPKRQP